MGAGEDFSSAISSVISTANGAFAKGKTKPAEWRRRQLRQLIKMLDESEEDIVAALHKDLRKPRNESISYETEYTKNVCRGLLNDLDECMADEYVAKNALTLLDTTFIHREPYGLVLIIGPWNFPLQLARQMSWRGSSASTWIQSASASYAAGSP